MQIGSFIKNQIISMSAVESYGINEPEEDIGTRKVV